jgi:circadian clock protein KaiB
VSFRRTERDAAVAMVKLVLFVAGESPNSVAALANLHRAIELEGSERFELEIVDVFERADRALAEHVLVTPTLIRIVPPSVRRLVGDLSATIELYAFLRPRTLSH